MTSTSINISDMTTYYSRLNAVRTRHHLATITAPTLAAGAVRLSSQITKVKTDIELTTTQSSYIPDKTYTISSIGVGNPYRIISDTQIKTALSEIEAYCYADYVNHSNHGDYSDNDPNCSSDNGTDFPDCSDRGSDCGGDNMVSYTNE